MLFLIFLAIALVLVVVGIFTDWRVSAIGTALGFLAILLQTAAATGLH